jgi:hypothetical protein
LIYPVALTVLGDTYYISEDNNGIARAATDFAECVKLLRSVGAIQSASLVTALTGGVVSRYDDEE